MTIHRSWLTGFRLFVVSALFALTGGTALAFQGDLKDNDEEDDTEFPGLVEEGEYVSPQFDVGISWTDAWAVGDESNPDVEHAIGGNFDGPVASDPQQGDIVFLVDTASETSVLSLGFSPAAEAIDVELLEQSMGQASFLEDNLFLSEDAEIVLLESTNDTVAILAREAAPNDDHVVYMEIVADPGSDDYTFWAGLDMYESEEYANILTSMEDDIDVEDNSIFAVFGADEMLEALESETPVDPTEEATEEATEEPATEEATEEPATEEPTEEPATEEATEEPVIPPFEQTQTPLASPEASPEGEPTETAVASPEASPAADDEFPGLVSEGDYLSPQHDVAITWSDAWLLDPDTEQPVQSFTESGVDSLYLTDSASESAIVYITVENNSGAFDPAAALEAVSNPDYIENTLQLDPASEIALTDTDDDGITVMYLDTSGESPFVSILEARLIDEDTIVFIELRADAADIDADLLNAAEDDIQVDGEDALDSFSAEDVLAALP
jgi:hypothetical protein